MKAGFNKKSPFEVNIFFDHILLPAWLHVVQKVHKKNSKTNQGGKYKREIKDKYKKNRTRGDKGQNLRKKKKNR